MKLEHQVCSLELAKQLKELGVPQESYFVWNYGGKLSGPWTPELTTWEALRRTYGSADSAYSQYSAFTVAELGEMLPDKVCQYWENGVVNTLYDDPEHYKGFSGNEADARAKMLIYLLNRRIITFAKNLLA